MTTRAHAGVAATGGLALATLLTMSHALNDAWTSLLSPLLPQIASAYQVTIGQTAILVAILSFVGSMLQPLMGALGDHIDRRLLAAFGPVLTAAGMTTLGYAPNFWLLGGLVMLGGLGSAIFHPAGAAFIARGASAGRRGLFVSIFSAGGTVGMALSPLIADAFTLRTLPYLLPLGLLLGAITYAVTPADPSSSRTARRLADYVAVFKGPIRLLWGMSVLRSLSSVAYASLLGFLLASRGAGDHLSASLAVYNAASALGGVVGGRLSDRLGRTAVIRSSILLTIPLFIGLVYSHPGQWWYYPLTALVGAMVMANIPVSIVAAQEYAPDNMATASALMMGFAWGTSGVLYLLIGKLADLTSPATAMVCAILLLLPAVALAARLPEPPRAGPPLS
ncbi:MAG TPA: MFS transporter [Herpetosiphonaceae bacterium]